jgi:hypothetical protein
MALTKIDDRGLKTPIDLIDNEKIRLGTGNDLEIYHDGSNNVISGTVNNWIKSTGTQGFTAGSDYQLTCVADGAVNLYYDNSKKLETTSDGVTVTGTGYVSSGWRPSSNGGASLGSSSYRWYDLNISNDIDISDNGVIQLGDGDDLKIYHDGSASRIDNLTGSLILRVNTDEKAISCVPNGTVELYHNNSKRLATSLTGIEIHGDEGGDCEIYLYADQGDDNADRWKFSASEDASRSRWMNKNSGSWETSIECNGDGNVELYHNNSKVFETLGNGVRAQGGIMFGSDTADANRLTDYEDGTWTPTLHNGTCTTSHCYYRLIGHQCTVWGNVKAMSDTSTNDMVKVQSLPFGVLSGWAGVAGGVMASYISEEKPWQPYVDTTSSGQIRFYASHSGGFHQLRHNELNTSHEIYFMVTYPIA